MRGIACGNAKLLPVKYRSGTVGDGQYIADLRWHCGAINDGIACRIGHCAGHETSRDGCNQKPGLGSTRSAMFQAIGQLVVLSHGRFPLLFKNAADWPKKSPFPALLR